MVYCYNYFYCCITILLSLGNYANERVVEMNFFTDEKQLIVSTNKRLLLLILGNRSNYATSSSTITTTTTSNINSSSVVVTPFNASLKRLSLSPKSSSSPSVLSSTLSPSATVSTPITTAENISSTSSPPSPSSSSSSTTTTKPFLVNNIESSKNESEDSTFISSNLKHENLDIIGWVELDRAIPGKKGIFAMYATSKYVPISPGASTAKLQRIITQWRIVEEDNEMSFAYHKSSSSSSSSGKKKSNCSIYRFEWTDEMFQSALDKIKYF